MKMNKKILILAAAGCLAGGSALFYVLNAEDPKETVIKAFGDVCAPGQPDPAEELFGISGLLKAASHEDSLTVKLEQSTDETLNRFAGAGLRLSSALSQPEDGEPSGARALAELALVYQDMDVLSFETFFGDRTVQTVSPQLFPGEVLTVDLGEGLADRIRDSAVFGPALTDAGIDIDAFAEYVDELLAQAQEPQEADAKSFDPAALMERYRGSCQALTAFREALTVEKAETGTRTVDGTEQSCRGYTVEIGKAAVIDFLRTSSDFFLQDEELKQDFIRRLEASVRLTEILGGQTGSSAGELQEQQYAETQARVDELIEALDKSLGDIRMTVYVTKDGRLASFSGTTVLAPQDTAESGTEPTEVAFSAELAGGAWRTQNVNAELSLTNSDGPLTVTLLKQGTYDGSSLTSDLALTVTQAETEYSLSTTGTYLADNGSFHLGADFGQDGTQAGSVSVTGTVDELEKGSRIHILVDSAEFLAGEDSLVLSGECSRGPLQNEVTAPEGTAFDVLAATEDDWSTLLTQAVLGIIGIAGQLGIPLI